MEKPGHSRRFVRLSLYKGLAVLSRPGLPVIHCGVTDLSEGGCRCHVDFGALDGQVGSEWGSAMEPCQPVEVELRGDSRLEQVRFPAEVRHVHGPAGGLLDLGLEFHGLSAQQRQCLAEALRAVSRERLRGLWHSKLPPAAPPAASGSTPAAGASVGAQEAVAAATPAAAGAEAQPALAAAGDPAALAATVVAPAVAPAVGGLAASEAGPAPVLPSAKGAFKGVKLGEILVHMGVLTEAQLAEGVEEARERHLRLGRCLWEKRWVGPVDICTALSLQSGLPTVDLGALEIPSALAHLFSYLTMRRYEFIPIEQSHNTLRIAAVRPLRIGEVAELERKTGSQVIVYLAPEDVIVSRIARIGAERHRERRHPRFKATLPVTWRFCTAAGVPLNDKTVRGRVLDMSEGGFRVEGEDPQTGPLENLVRDGVRARITLTSGPQEIQAVCSVRFARVAQTQHGAATCVFGFQILEMAEAHRTVLREVCIRNGIHKVRPKTELGMGERM